MYPAAFLIHSATLTARHQVLVLEYESGTAAFTPGKTLTGATSGATAIIVSTGSIVTGSLSLHSINGTFQDEEVIHDNGTVPGAAIVNGTIGEAFDVNGELVYSDITTTAPCRFSPQGTTIKGNPLTVSTVDTVVFPPTVSVAMGDQVIATETGFTGTYTISKKPRPTYEAAQKIVSHWTCELAKAGGA